MTLLDLSAVDVLNTTRAVRKRLDFSRPVDDELIRECVATAMQAPSGSNNMTMQFVVVKDAEKRRAIGEVYKQCWAIYSSLPVFAGAIEKDGAAERAQQDRVVDSATHLSEHMADAPALVLGCTAGRVDGIPFDEIQQACLTPLAHTVGTDFKRAMRPDPDTIIHWDKW